MWIRSIIVGLVVGGVLGFSGPASPDMLIRLKNGKIIRLPYDSQDVETVVFVDDSGKEIELKPDHPRKASSPEPGVSARKPTTALPLRPGLPPCPVDICVGDMWSDGLSHTADLKRRKRHPLPDGAIIYIAPGRYQYSERHHCTVIYGNRLTIHGVSGPDGGRPHIFTRPEIRSHRKSLCGKALWVIGGNDVTVENLVFSGAHVAGDNGAGIRLEGINLTVRNSLFYENDMGILGGPGCNPNKVDQRNRDSFVRIEGSTFKFMRSHNFYVLCVGTLYFIDSITAANGLPADARHDLKGRGKILELGGKHLFKSVSHNVVVENSKFLDTFEDYAGHSSFLIDMSGCGDIRIANSLFMQNSRTDNRTALIHIGTRGCEDAKQGDVPIEISYRNQNRTVRREVFSNIRFENNRFDDEKGLQSFVKLRANWPVVAAHNTINGKQVGLSDLVSVVIKP
ncbi:MAG: hypothetical protein ACE5EM_09445 [Sphingomonadales bacterium]